MACRQFHAGINRFILHLSSITSHFLNVLLWMIFNLLTAQLQACAGLVLHVVFFFFFFSFVGELTKTSARPNAGQDI